MTRVGIIGATGYTGAELIRILSQHPEIELTTITSRQHPGKGIADVYPGFANHTQLMCELFDHQSMCDKADIVFTALPHKLPMGLVPKLVAAGKKIIDLSADFRFKNADTYEAHYQPHTAKELLSDAVYGLSEPYHEQIKTAKIIGNPGCYPTSVLLPLIPLIREKLIDTTRLIIDSKSGVSGAGRGLALTTHFCEVNESFKAYKVGAHRHTPEIEEILSHEKGREVSITFVPHLLPLTRGMLSTIYTQPVSDKTTITDINECLKSFYQKAPFINICNPDQMPDTLHVKGTNKCEIGFQIDRDQLIIVSAIDNLGKGAAGQAVQNMNIMLGIEETTGLSVIPHVI